MTELEKEIAEVQKQIAALETINFELRVQEKD